MMSLYILLMSSTTFAKFSKLFYNYSAASIKNRVCCLMGLYFQYRIRLPFHTLSCGVVSERW